jgi:hypothetical protein
MFRVKHNCLLTYIHTYNYTTRKVTKDTQKTFITDDWLADYQQRWLTVDIVLKIIVGANPSIPVI